MSSGTKLKKVISSPQLADYKIPKAITEKLERAMEMRTYMQLGGKTPPCFIRLLHVDWVAIDDKVRTQSDGRYNAATVLYKTLPIISERDQPQCFALAS